MYINAMLAVQVLNTCVTHPTAPPPPTPPSVTNGHTSKTDTNKNEIAIANSNASASITTTNGIVKEKHKRSHADLLASITTTLTEPKIKQARIQEKITYDDLAADKKSNSIGPTQLNLAKVERYLHGPVPIASGSHNDVELMSDTAAEQLRDLDAVQYMIRQDTESWKQRTPHKVLVSPTAAVNALGELSPGGALMRGFQEQSLARKFLLKVISFSLIHF